MKSIVCGDTYQLVIWQNFRWLKYERPVFGRLDGRNVSGQAMYAGPML